LTRLQLGLEICYLLLVSATARISVSTLEGCASGLVAKLRNSGGGADEKKIADLEAKLKSCQDSEAKLKAEIARLQAEAKKLKAERDAEAAAAAEANARLAALDKCGGISPAELAQMRQDLKALKEANEKLTKELEEIGCCAIMPLGSLIGSGQGISNPFNIKLIKESSNVPVLVDAGIGCASDAARAMELGCDGVLMNSAIFNANDPVLMASAMKHAIIAGRESYLAGRMMKKAFASATSPLENLI
jgi:uncharacterized protein related to proFAR isomerase